MFATQYHEDAQRRFKPLSAAEERTGKLIVNAAYVVHKEFGPGLLEKVYEVCFCHVLAKDGCVIKGQLDIPIVFEDIVFSEGLRLDVLVNDLYQSEMLNSPKCSFKNIREGTGTLYSRYVNSFRGFINKEAEFFQVFEQPVRKCSFAFCPNIFCRI